MRTSDLKTVSGHPLFEVVSALQKSIRRGLERDALYWATEMDMSNYGEYVWKRLRIISSEDVGVAEANIPTNIRALYENWKDAKKKKDTKNFPERLFLVHAVVLLSRAKKSRIIDHALLLFYNAHRDGTKEMPDYVYDKHTGKGRSMGRGVQHFFDEASHLENMADVTDPYKAGALKIMLETNGKQRGQGGTLDPNQYELPL